MKNNVFAAERKRLGLTQEQLAKKLNTSRSNVANWENGQNMPSLELLFKCSEIFGCDVVYLAGYQDERIKADNNEIPEYIDDNEPIRFIDDLCFDNAKPVELSHQNVKIPVLGTIKAGVPINAQQDILEYVDIPEEWTRGGKEFYGLKISGDSMEPKYNEKDIVIFEHTDDYSIANNKDCAVMVNGDDATFKNVSISEAGLTLIPGNLNNSDGYKPTFYSIEQIEKLPVKIIGIAREKRTRL